MSSMEIVREETAGPTGLSLLGGEQVGSTWLGHSTVSVVLGVTEEGTSSKHGLGPGKAFAGRVLLKVRPEIARS